MARSLSNGPNRRFKINKRSQQFIRTHNETLIVVTLRVSNEDRSPLWNPRSQYSPRLSGLHAVTPSDIFSWPRPDVRLGSQHDNFSRERSARLSR